MKPILKKNARGLQQKSAPAYELIRLAELNKTGRLTELFSSTLEVLKRYPSCFETWNFLGDVSLTLGNSTDALSAFKTALKLNPSDARVNKNLAITEYMLGNNEKALNFFKIASSLSPKDPDNHFNIGNILKDLGDINGAISAYKHCIALNPKDSEAYNNLGTALLSDGEINKAIIAYEKAIQLVPSDPNAHNNLGLCFHYQKRFKEAEEKYNEALRLNPKSINSLFNLGNVYLEKKNFLRAIQYFGQTIQIDPNANNAFNNLGLCLAQIGDNTKAIQAYKNSISINPNNSNVHFNLGNAYRDVNRNEKAIESYKNGLAIDPLNAVYLNDLGILLAENDRVDEALSAYQASLDITGGDARTFLNIGNLYKNNNEIENAISAYNKALKLKMDYADVYKQLSSLIKYERGHPHIEVISKLLTNNNSEDIEKCRLHFAFAKINEDLNELKIAFQHYVEGGRIKKALLSYDISQDKTNFELIKSNHTKIKSIKLSVKNSTSKSKPIFIIGMPRSGTSLTEQIITSHSQVFGAGELPIVNNLFSSMSLGISEMTCEKLLELRAKYLNEMAAITGKNKFFTDKMPQNFMHLGVIIELLPEAKIVHVHRNPKATCWSNFKHLFTSNSMGYSYDLEDVVQYYQYYKDLMKYWEQTYPNKIYHLDYEQLTSNPHLETKKLIQHLRLNWEDACLHPHENSRQVKTASQHQVKKKIYKNSSSDWEKFESYLHKKFNFLT